MNHITTSLPVRQRDLSEHLIQLGLESARRATIAPTRNLSERHLRIAAACIDRLDELRAEFLTSGSMAKKQDT